MSLMRELTIRSAVMIGITLALPMSLQAEDNAAAAAVQPIDVLNTLVGQWDGQLEYLDYSTNDWFGIPARIEIRSGGDGVTFIRASDFDDGPKVGIVRITGISMIGSDGVTEYSTSFRKGRVPEMSVATLRVDSYGDATHWVLVSEGAGMDDDRPATLRLTTTRDGGQVVTVKTVDFTDDEKAEWLVRNRTVLTMAE